MKHSYIFAAALLLSVGAFATAQASDTVNVQTGDTTVHVTSDAVSGTSTMQVTSPGQHVSTSSSTGETVIVTTPAAAPAPIVMVPAVPVVKAETAAGLVLTNTQITNKSYAGQKLQNSSLTNMKLLNVDFKGADLSGSTFTNVTFEGGDLSDANVKGASFTNVTFSNVKVVNTDFTQATLVNTDVPH